MQTRTFRGGVHPDGSKLSAESALRVIPPPQIVSIPLKQHIGIAVQPLVKVGDVVSLGQKIGDSDQGLCAPVHASVSGKVKAIQAIDSADGKTVQAIVLENDGEDRIDESITPFDNWATLHPSELKQLIREAGIVGMGGAGFPTHAKLSVPEGKKLSVLIINGVECEPYLTGDHRILLEYASRVLLGIKVLMRAATVEKAYIGVKITMAGIPAAFDSLLQNEPGVDLVLLESKFPQGEERQLVYAITEQEIPSSGLPWDVGALVCNASTAWAIGTYIETGMPSIERPVTVTGAVKNPSNFMTRIGTPIQYLIEQAGGFEGEPGTVIMGGPMTGLPQLSLKTTICKQNNGVLVFTKQQMKKAHETDCIRCGKCVEVCPWRLMPIYMAKESQREDVSQMQHYNILDCRECGSCAYTCPARIPLLHWIRLGKGLVQAARRG